MWLSTHGFPLYITDGHERISMEEVCSSIWRLKNGKAPGVWGVTGEMLKAGGKAVVQWLHKIIDLSWRSGVFQWTGRSTDCPDQ